jgi:hypothetical protein
MSEKKMEYTVSRPQLARLVERAGEGAVREALIQNGSAPDRPIDFKVSRQQLKKLVERAGASALEDALIQNGSAPK